MSGTFWWPKKIPQDVAFFGEKRVTKKSRADLISTKCRFTAFQEDFTEMW
jgi:hypothetical protein